jgi:outer membrane protein assembly factor BamB
MRRPVRSLLLVTLGLGVQAIAVPAFVGPAAASPTTGSNAVLVATGIQLSRTVGPPTTTVTVTGSGFGANEAVDIYVDTFATALTTTDANGAFTADPVRIPTSAIPGTHWITAIGRRDGLAAQASFLVQTDWPQFHDTATHRGVNSYENVLNTTTVKNLQEDWVVRGLNTQGDPVAVAGGIVYVTQYGALSAFKTSTGALAWSHAPDAGDSLGSSPSADGGKVFVGSQNGNLYAVKASTGATAWTQTTAGAIYGTPTISGGMVYVGSLDHFVYAFKASSGAFVWKQDTGSQIYESPTVASGVVYVTTQAGVEVEYDALTGGDPNGVYGNSYTAGGAIQTSPVVSNGVAYFGSADSYLYAVNVTNQALLWKAQLNPSFGIDSTPAVAAGMAYVGGIDGKLTAVNTSNGTVAWSVQTGNPIHTAPAVANGVVYVSVTGSKTMALAASNGALLWSASLAHSFAGSPAVADGVVYTSGQDGTLRAWDLTAQQRAPGRKDPRTLRR